jgi:hypothetical protein
MELRLVLVCSFRIRIAQCWSRPMLGGYLDFLDIRLGYQLRHLTDITWSDIQCDIQGVGYHPTWHVDIRKLSQI